MCEMGITMPASQSCCGIYESKELILRPGCHSVPAPFFSLLDSRELSPFPIREAGLAGNDISSHIHSVFLTTNQFAFVKHTEQANWVYICLLGLPCKVPQTGWLKQQKFLFSQFQVLEVQDEVSSGLVPSKTTLLGLEMAIFPCILTWFSLSMFLCL